MPGEHSLLRSRIDYGITEYNVLPNHHDEWRWVCYVRGGGGGGEEVGTAKEGNTKFKIKMSQLISLKFHILY